MTTRAWVLIPLAIAVNLSAFGVVNLLRLPLYLDSLGTILAGALCGPGAGALTGLLSNLVVAVLWAPTMAPFAAVAAAVGALAGWLASRGFFTRLWLAVLAGLFTGTAAAFLSAPLSAYLFGGVTGGGTDLLVAWFRAAGRDALEASLAQGLLVDPADKMISFTLVAVVLSALPPGLRRGFPAGEALGEIPPLGWRLRGGGGKAGRRRGRPGRAEAPSLYVAGEGWLYRRAPFTKVCLVALGLAAALSLPGQGGSGTLSGALVGAGLLGFALAVAGGVALPMARAVAALWGPLALSMVAVNGLFGPEPRSLLVGLVPWSPSGGLACLALALRVLVVLEAALLLVLTTRPDHLVADLERRGLPPKVAYVVLASLHLIPAMRGRAGEIRNAQSARGLASEGGLGVRLRALLPLVGPLLLGALAEVEERAMALEVRAFGARRRRTRLVDPPGAPVDTLWQGVFLAAAAALVWRGPG